jgi:hypothetical protein
VQTFERTRFSPKEHVSAREEPEPKKGRWSIRRHSKASKDPKGKKGIQYESYLKLDYKEPSHTVEERMKSVDMKKPPLVLNA